MIKKILIILGVVLILSVVGVWLYLFLTGTTAQNENFAQFGDGSEDIFFEDISNEQGLDTGAVAINKKRLQQLTIRPVAGAALVDENVVYVEAGTGHIYQINLETGNEILLSGTTLPHTHNALFSKTGTYIAVTQYLNNTPRTIVGSFSNESGFEGVSLPEGATEVGFSKEDEGVVYYLSESGTGSFGVEYDVEKAQAVRLFETPLRDIRVLWGNDIYIYTTPTSEQVGYVYEVVGNDLRYVDSGEYGMVVVGTNSEPLVTKTIDGNFVSTQKSNGVRSKYSGVIPEKCISVVSGLICGIPQSLQLENFPDDWYKGVVSYSDTLWDIDFETQTSASLIDLLGESGRKIDVFKIGTDEMGEKVWFINKNDNSLWLFDATL